MSNTNKWLDNKQVLSLITQAVIQTMFWVVAFILTIYRVYSYIAG